MKTIEQAKAESTCQKRPVVCALYDENGSLLARESNRCNPTGGTCHRLGITQSKDGYDAVSECNWTHAEIMALSALQPGDKPHYAVVYGHSFICDNCEKALKAAGVQHMEVRESLETIQRRN